MSSHPHFRHPYSKTVTITEAGWVSPHAKFVFDEPLTLKPGKVIWLIDGQWWIKVFGELVQVAGKWELQ